MTPQLEDDVTSILSAVAKYGLPSALVCYLVYVGVNQIVADVHHTRSILEQHIEATNELKQIVMRLEAINRQSCVNAATDKQQQQACWSAGYR